MIHCPERFTTGRSAALHSETYGSAEIRATGVEQVVEGAGANAWPGNIYSR